jgi:hypothetical protein
MRKKMFKKNNLIKKIIFKATNDAAQFLADIPKPSSNIIPDWYKKEKNFANGENDFKKSLKSTNKYTFKLCVPFVDTLTSGYLISLPADVLVKNIGTETNYLPIIHWSVDFPIADVVDLETATNYPTPIGFDKNIHRWIFNFKIITPNGYSSWITHPSHRWDLPFLTINGFVDTDKHPNSLLLPFFIKNGFEGIIPEGTPIAQIIPIKREHWKSEKMNKSIEDSFMNKNSTKINILKTYRNKYWTKKKYE